MPSHTPYERETLIEQLEAATRRYGSARLLVDRQDWRVSFSTQLRVLCTQCKRPVGTLTYRHAGTTLCTSCARRSLQ
jgi:hypothetical protein